MVLVASSYSCDRYYPSGDCRHPDVAFREGSGRDGEYGALPKKSVVAGSGAVPRSPAKRGAPPKDRDFTPINRSPKHASGAIKGKSRPREEHSSLASGRGGSGDALEKPRLAADRVDGDRGSSDKRKPDASVVDSPVGQSTPKGQAGRGRDRSPVDRHRSPVSLTSGDQNCGSHDHRSGKSKLTVDGDRHAPTPGSRDGKRSLDGRSSGVGDRSHTDRSDGVHRSDGDRPKVTDRSRSDAGGRSTSERDTRRTAADRSTVSERPSSVTEDQSGAGDRTKHPRPPSSASSRTPSTVTSGAPRSTVTLASGIPVSDAGGSVPSPVPGSSRIDGRHRYEYQRTPASFDRQSDGNHGSLNHWEPPIGSDLV